MKRRMKRIRLGTFPQGAEPLVQDLFYFI